MKTMILPAVLALGAALLSACPAQAADEFFVAINGAKQGLFHGESAQKGHEGQIPGLKYDYSATVPTSNGGGGGSVGKLHHTPVVFEKEWGAATTQIYQALVTNERLKSVTFEFFSADLEGLERPAFRVTLTNALVVSIHQHVGDTRHDSTLDTRRYEDVSLSFQTIMIEDETSSVRADVGIGARRAPASRPGTSPGRPARMTARAQTPVPLAR